MATNRMYLVCDGCGGKIMLGKRLSIGYYKAVQTKALEKFFDQHERPECLVDRLDNFTVGYEDEEMRAEGGRG